MCNLYAQKAGPQAIIKAAKAAYMAAGNLESGSIYPDYAAPIVRMEGDERILTIEPSEPVKSGYPKAMPVILAEPDELEMWMGVDWAFAKSLQRPLPDGALLIV